jgi:ribosome biogenesis protein ENP2
MFYFKHLQKNKTTHAMTHCHSFSQQKNNPFLGVYKPRVRVWELSELSLKFERFLDCEAVDFKVCFVEIESRKIFLKILMQLHSHQILSNDWRKIAFLRADRTIELHASYGKHFKTRIPKVC